MNFFSFLLQNDLHLANDKKVIPAKDFSHLISAKKVVQKAKEEAEIYQKESEKQRIEILELAKQEGFEAGLQKFNESIIHFEQEIKRLQHDKLQMVLPLAIKAAKKIVGKELELFPETIVDIVLQTIAPFAHNQRITIYVSKGEKDLLEKNRPRLNEILSQVKSLNIVEKEEIAPGGCEIATETGIINARLENQWIALEAAFERYKKL